MFIPTSSAAASSTCHHAALILPDSEDTPTKEIQLTPFARGGKLLSVDSVFDELVRLKKITPECSWVKVLPVAILGGEAQQRRDACLEWLSQMQLVKAADGSFEICYSYLELFRELGLFDFYIIGSGILAHVLGGKCLQQAFAQQGICSITDAISKEALNEILHSNDVDFRFFVQQAPDSYTKRVVSFFAKKLSDGPLAHLSMYQREELVRGQIVVEFCRSAPEAPHPFAMISFGQCDLFFSAGPLQRSYLYHGDAWRVHCRVAPHFEMALEGDFNAGWDSLLLQMMRVLKTDRIDSLNFLGTISFFFALTKGKRALSADLEKEFASRLLHLVHSLGPEKCQKSWLKSVTKHFPAQPQAALCVVLNMTFFFDELVGVGSMPFALQEVLDSPSVKEAVKLSPFWQLLHGLLCREQGAKEEVKGCLSPFLQVFAHLHSAEKQNSTGAHEIECFMRKMGGRQSLVIRWCNGKQPLYLAVGDRLYASLLKIKPLIALATNAKELFEELHQLHIHLLPPATEEWELFSCNEGYGADPLYGADDFESEFQKDAGEQAAESLAHEGLQLLLSEAAFFQQLGFRVLCYDGIIRCSSTYFPSLMRALGPLLIGEKSPAMRQQLLAHFIQYIMRTSRFGRLVPYCDKIQAFYACLGRKHIAPKEIMQQFVQIFAAIDLLDCAGAASRVWGLASLQQSGRCDFTLGSLLFEKLPPSRTAEALQVFSMVLSSSKEPYRRLAELFFQMDMVATCTVKTASACSQVGQLLIQKVTKNAQMPAADQKRFIELAKLIIPHAPVEGMDMLLLLEGRQLLPKSFKQLFCELLAKEKPLIKAQLLLIWIAKVTEKTPLQGIRASQLEERIDLLLEGVACTPPLELAEKLALWLARHLLEGESQKLNFSSRLQEKLDIPARWIYETLCAYADRGGCSRHFPAAFLQSMQRLGRPLKLTAVDLDRLERDLMHLVQTADFLDLVRVLLPMHLELSKNLRFLRDLALAAMAASKYDCAAVYVRKMADLGAPAELGIPEMALKCTEGALKTGFPMAAYQLVENFVDHPLFTASLKVLLPELIKALAMEFPKEGMHVLIHFYPGHATHEFTPQLIAAVEKIVVGSLPYTLKALPKEGCREKSRAKAIGTQEEEVFLKDNCYRTIYHLMLEGKISSPGLWKAFVSHMPLEQDAKTCEAVLLLFRELSEAPSCQMSPADRAFCWSKLLPLMAKVGVKCVDVLLRDFKSQVQLFLEHLPKRQHQSTLSALLDAYLSVALNMELQQDSQKASRALVAAARFVELAMEKKGMYLLAPSQQLKWMALYLSFSDSDSMLTFFQRAIPLFRKWHSEKAWQQLDLMRPHIEKSVVCLESLSSAELQQLLPHTIAYLDCLLACGQRALLMPYFFWLSKIQSFFFLHLEVKFVPHIYNHSLVCGEKESRALHQLLTRLMEANLLSDAFQVLQIEIFSKAVQRSFKASLLNLYLNDPFLISYRQSLQEAILLGVGLMVEAESSEECFKVPLSRIMELILALYFEHAQIDLCREVFCTLLQFFFDCWPKSSKRYKELSVNLSQNLCAMIVDCKELGVMDFKHTEGLFYPKFYTQGASNSFSIEAEDFVVVLGVAARILSKITPKTVREQHFIDLQSFYLLHMMVEISPENEDLHILILDDFSTHPLVYKEEKDLMYFVLFEKIRQRLMIGLAFKGITEISQTIAFKWNMLLGNSFPICLSNQLSPEQQLGVMLRLILKLVENNSIPDLYVAIQLLATYQELIFAPYAPELKECYNLLFSKIEARPTATFGKVSLKAIFFDALANVSKVLPYDFHFSQVMLEKYLESLQ